MQLGRVETLLFLDFIFVVGMLYSAFSEVYVEMLHLLNIADSNHKYFITGLITTHLEIKE